MPVTPFGDTAEGVGLIFIALCLMALIPTIAAYALERASLAIIGVLFWVILGVFAYGQIIIVGDVMWAVFFGSIFMGFMAGIEPFITSRKNKKAMLDPGDHVGDQAGSRYEREVDAALSKRQQDNQRRARHKASVMGNVTMTPERRNAMETRQLMKGVNRKR